MNAVAYKNLQSMRIIQCNTSIYC